MTLATFLYPIVESGFFEFQLLEIAKETTPPDVALKFRYSLRNSYPITVQIPINIVHIAYLNCRQERDFKQDKSPRIVSNRVLDLQSNKLMYGYGDDHHVIFEPNEKKEFLVLFEPSATDFETFDTEFLMKPEDAEYGLYRLRYDFQSGRIIRRFCLKTHKLRTHK